MIQSVLVYGAALDVMLSLIGVLSLSRINGSSMHLAFLLHTTACELLGEKLTIF